MAYSIQQLAAHVGVSVETVKYYIKQGAVPHPRGPRCRPIYDNSHLRALMRVRALLEENRSVADIAETLAPRAHVIKLNTGGAA